MVGDSVESHYLSTQVGRTTSACRQTCGVRSNHFLSGIRRECGHMKMERALAFQCRAVAGKDEFAFHWDSVTSELPGLNYFSRQEFGNRKIISQKNL